MAGTSPHFEPECSGSHRTSAQQAYNTRSSGYRATEGVEGCGRARPRSLGEERYVKAHSTGLELIHYRIPATAKTLSGITFERR
jgi:hypothetical protein